MNRISSQNKAIYFIVINSRKSSVTVLLKKKLKANTHATINLIIILKHTYNTHTNLDM